MMRLTVNMFRRFLSLISLWLKAFNTTDEKTSCYHCGEKSSRRQTIYVLFDGATRPVCCYGCAAILNTVEELDMHAEYHAHKVHIQTPNK